MIGAPDGDSYGMSETDKPAQPRAIAVGDGLSLTPRKAYGWCGNKFYFLIDRFL